MATVHESLEIAGVMLVEPVVHGDARGMFVETFRHEWVPQAREMIQMNRADRAAGCIVGLHYHRFQADFWYVPFGHARIVLHDLRPGSPTDGVTQQLDRGTRPDGTHNHGGIYIPPGVAHGFSSLTDMTITYLDDGYYDPADELGVAWDDPAVGDVWGLTEPPTLSARDAANPRRADIAAEMLPAAH